MNRKPVRTGTPPVDRRPPRDSEWAEAKVRDAVRRAALMGAAELRLLAAQMAAGPRR